MLKAFLVTQLLISRYLKQFLEKYSDKTLIPEATIFNIFYLSYSEG